ncbi:MAG: rRNA maturation RNase YbeY [Candidatus Paceibacterota bacterium]|jgi:probable rRNA maturation factor
MNTLSVVYRDRRLMSQARLVRVVAQKVLRAVHRDKSAVSLFLLPSTAMRRINRLWHHADQATNILSFSEPREFIHPPQTKKMLGEIYLCPAYIQAHGEAIDFLVVHGMLHLLGYDHVRQHDRLRMEKAERRICRAIGVAWPYEEE